MTNEGSALLSIAVCVCSVLCIVAFATTATSGYMTVRGVLKHVVGPGGETTGFAVLLDAPIKIDGAEVNQLEIDSDKSPNFVDKYVQASGTIVYYTGVAIPRRPVLKVSDLQEARADGKAQANLVQKTVSISIQPAVIVWKTITGQSSGVQPKLTFSVKNDSKTDLVFDFRTSAQICFSTRDANTRKDLWRYPDVSSDVVSKVTVKTGETFSKSTTLPEKGAPTPGTYILKGTICGYDDYQLTAQFVVGAS